MGGIVVVNAMVGDNRKRDGDNEDCLSQIDREQESMLVKILWRERV